MFFNVQIHCYLMENVAAKVPEYVTIFSAAATFCHLGMGAILSQSLNDFY